LGVIRVVTLQPSLAWHTPQANFGAIETAVLKAVAHQRIDLLVLPEAFDGTPVELQDCDISAETFSFLEELARKAHAFLVGGSVACRRPNGQVVNACPILDPGGRRIGEYAKRKLFAAELDFRTAGNSPGIYNLGEFRLGVLICSDLWYPELARELMGQVDILCVPTKTTVASVDYVSYARTVWWSLALTRSVENALPVVVSDWCEKGHATHFTSGATSISDPAGRPDPFKLQQKVSDGSEGFILAEIDLEAVREIQAYRRGVGLLPPDRGTQQEIV